MPLPDESIMPVARQIQLLIGWSELRRPQHYTLREIAQAAGISTQALTNILDGKASDPRLTTLRNLCRFFQVSLDYFGGQTEIDCRAYLARRAVELGTSALQQITLTSHQLSPRGQDNVLVILQWFEIKHDH